MFKTFCSKRIMLILLIGSILMVLSAQSRDIILNDHKNETTLQSNNEYGFSVLYRVANLTLEKISTQKGDFEQINVAGFGQTHRIGEPQLPSSNRIVAVPLGAKLNFEVLRQQKMQLDPKDSTLKHRIFPAQAPISKSAEPSSINFAYNETIYSQKDLIGKELFSAQEIGIMRGVRLFLISFEPIRYNPQSGDFSMYAWELTGNESWYIDSAESHQGSYAAKSGTITHNQLSSLKVNRMLSNPGSISFWYKVSSESNYDWLRFYVDGNLKDEWSGTVDWSEASYDLTAGERELEWVYSKDGSVSNGSDCAWIDYIVFPASTAPSNLYPPRNLRAIPSDGRITLNWQAPSSGMADSYQIFKDNNLLATISSLSYQDDAVTNGIQYTYYVLAVYPEGNSDPSNIVTCTPGSYTEAIIGSGTESSAANASTPINIWYKSLHGQSIYTAAELNSAGMVGQSTITELGFYVTGAPVSPLPSFLIRMKHSSNPDVANWQSSQDMQLVYNTASYSPTEGGFDMITLTNPFIWNGVDNIVVDTAFGLLDNYDQSGTLQISDMTNGYRYVRNDNYDQSAVFSDGYTADYRPNIRFVFEAAASNEARILVEPANLEFADTAVGNSNSLSLRIRNMGDIALSGSITTPPSFSINQRTMASDEKDIRNTLDFSVAAGTYHDYPVIFAPAAIGEYSGNIQISSNAANSPTETIPLSGYGYLPPAISLDSEGLSANLQIGEEASDSFTITNAGGQTLEYSISLAEQRQLNANLSSGNQQRSISGNTITWFGESDAGWGIIHDNETGTAIISVTIPSSYQGNMELPYTINGDVYNAEPHTISDTFTLIQNIPPVEWLELSNLSGSLNPGESTLISASFSAVGFSEGTYQAMLTISSNDPENPAYPLTATMQVSDLSNHAPVINLPPSFSFEKNGSLQIDLSSYASDPDNDPLSMQILGNSNVLCDINQMTVTLTAEQNWVGSETISIVVSDTELVASAQTVINVLPVNEPEWEPVNYPNNPATIYAMVNIEGYPAQANDQIAAFVGNECRGTADIVLGRDTAYATIIVQMAEPGETVYFKVYSYLDDTIYDADISVQPDFGDEIGADDPLLIDAGNTTSLDQPIVSISSSNDTLHLNWDAVLHADYYEIYSCATPDGEFQILSTATDTSFAIDSSHPHRFYRVLAVKGIATK